MTERHEFIEKMQRALQELQVKSSLAKLELGDLKDELIDEYDHLHDKLRDMREENEDEWWAVKAGFLSSWDRFKERFHPATGKSDEECAAPGIRKGRGARSPTSIARNISFEVGARTTIRAPRIRYNQRHDGTGRRALS